MTLVIGMSRRLHASRATALLLLAAVAVGTVELHGDVTHRHSTSESGSSIVILEALHPALPAHFEAATSVTVRRCDACLLQRSHVLGLLPARWAELRPALDSAPASWFGDEPRTQPAPHRPSRAPPLT